MIDKTLWHGCFRLLFVVILLCSGATANADLGGGYLIQPGDILRISVWKEPDLQQDLLVRPDGGVSFPLAGDIVAAGTTLVMCNSRSFSVLNNTFPSLLLPCRSLKPMATRFMSWARSTDLARTSCRDHWT